jgi:hypothetical protein
VSADSEHAAAERVVTRGRQELHARLRAAILRQAGSAPKPVTLEAGQLDRLVDDAAARAGGLLWRRCLAGAASAELGIELADAVSHPIVERAHALAGVPPYEAPPVEALLAADPADPETTAAAPAHPPLQALRLSAVHVSGIESLRNGESDLELRFSDAGLDLIKASSGAAIGRLLWSEIHDVEVARSRRGMRPGRRAQELHVRAQSGRAVFQLPGMTEQQISEHLEPVLVRLRGGAGRS